MTLCTIFLDFNIFKTKHVFIYSPYVCFQIESYVRWIFVKCNKTKFSKAQHQIVNTLDAPIPLLPTTPKDLPWHIQYGHTMNQLYCESVYGKGLFQWLFIEFITLSTGFLVTPHGGKGVVVVGVVVVVVVGGKLTSIDTSSTWENWIHTWTTWLFSYVNTASLPDAVSC